MTILDMNGRPSILSTGKEQTRAQIKKAVAENDHLRSILTRVVVILDDYINEAPPDMIQELRNVLGELNGSTSCLKQ